MIVETVKYLATLMAGIAIGVFITVLILSEDPKEVSADVAPDRMRHFIISYSVIGFLEGHVIINNDVFPPLRCIQKWIAEAEGFPKTMPAKNVIITSIYELNESDYVTATINGVKQADGLKQYEND